MIWQTSGIAKINLMVGKELSLKSLADIPLMAETALGRLHRSLDAFVQQDTPLARTIPVEDEVVDALYAQVYRALLTTMIRTIRRLRRLFFF